MVLHRGEDHISARLGIAVVDRAGHDHRAIEPGREPLLHVTIQGIDLPAIEAVRRGRPTTYRPDGQAVASVGLALGELDVRGVGNTSSSLGNGDLGVWVVQRGEDRKSTRLNFSHGYMSYA